MKVNSLYAPPQKTKGLKGKKRVWLQTYQKRRGTRKNQKREEKGGWKNRIERDDAYGSTPNGDCGRKHRTCKRQIHNPVGENEKVPKDYII
jgi:hypothetical protein